MKSLITIISIFFSVYSIFSLASTSDDGTEALYERIHVINNLQATFVQVIKDHEGYAASPTQGKMSLQRPNKIYWETFAPQEQIVVSNGEKLWVYDPDLEQATLHTDGKTLEGPMTLLAQSLEQLRARFIVELTPASDSTSFLLTPRNPEAENDFATLVFEFKNKKLSGIVMHDRLRQETNIQFSNVVINGDISASLFDFTVPEGVDVVTNE